MSDQLSVITSLLDVQLRFSPIVLTKAQCQQYAIYLNELNHWQKTFNLSAITEISDQIPYHILDSLSIAPFLKGSRCLDIGTGAGLPGLILAIAYPEKSFALLDSVQKKIHFLAHIKAKLNLKNVEIIHSRAENFKSPPRWEGIITRAVSDLATLFKISAHLCGPDTLWYAMKGTYPSEEISQLPDGMRLLQAHSLSVPGLDAQRHLIILQKKQ